MPAEFATSSISGLSLLQREWLQSESYGKLHRSYCELKGVQLLLKADLDAAEELNALEPGSTEVVHDRSRIASGRVRADLPDEMESLRSEIASMHEQIDCKHFENERLLEHVEATCKWSSVLRSELEEREQNSEQDAREVQSLQLELKGLLHEHNEYKKSEEHARASAAELRTDLRHARLECDDRNSLLVRASGELHNLRSRVAHLREENSEHLLVGTELQSFREEAQSSACEMSLVQRASQQLHTECDKSRSEAKQLAAQVVLFHEEVLQVTAERDECEGHADRALDELLLTREELRHSHQECKEFLNLQSELEHMKCQATEREDVVAEMKSVHAEMSLLKTELDEAQAEISSSETLAEQASHKFGAVCAELHEEETERDGCIKFAETAHAEISIVLPVMKRTEAEYQEVCGRSEEATEEVATLRLQAESLASQDELRLTRQEAASRVESMQEEVAHISSDRDCLSWRVSQDAFKISELRLELAISKKERREIEMHAVQSEATAAELRAAVDHLRSEEISSAEVITLHKEIADYKNLTAAAGEAVATIKNLQAEVETVSLERDSEMQRVKALSHEVLMASAEANSCTGESSVRKKGDSPLLTAALSSPPCADSLSFSFASLDAFHVPGADETQMAQRYDRFVSEIVALNQELRSALCERDAQSVKTECAIAEVSALKGKVTSMRTERSLNARRAKRASSETRQIQHELTEAHRDSQQLHSELLRSSDSLSAMKMQSAQLRAELATARADLAGEAAALSMAKVESAAERRNDSALFRGELAIAMEAERRASEAQATARHAKLLADGANSVLSNNQEHMIALKEELANSRAQTARLCEQTSSVVLGVVKRFACDAGTTFHEERSHSHVSPSAAVAVDSEQV